MKWQCNCRFNLYDRLFNSGDRRDFDKSKLRFFLHQNICVYKPCLNNGKCFLGYTDKKFLCECRPGYTGELCETGDYVASKRRHVLSVYAPQRILFGQKHTSTSTSLDHTQNRQLVTQNLTTCRQLRDPLRSLEKRRCIQPGNGGQVNVTY